MELIDCLFLNGERGLVWLCCLLGGLRAAAGRTAPPKEDKPKQTNQPNKWMNERKEMNLLISLIEWFHLLKEEERERSGSGGSQLMESTCWWNQLMERTADASGAPSCWRQRGKWMNQIKLFFLPLREKKSWFDEWGCLLLFFILVMAGDQPSPRNHSIPWISQFIPFQLSWFVFSLPQRREGNPLKKAWRRESKWINKEKRSGWVELSWMIAAWLQNL